MGEDARKQADWVAAQKKEKAAKAAAEVAPSSASAVPSSAASSAPDAAMTAGAVWHAEDGGDDTLLTSVMPDEGPSQAEISDIALAPVEGEFDSNSVTAFETDV